MKTRRATRNWSTSKSDDGDDPQKVCAKMSWSFHCWTGEVWSLGSRDRGDLNRVQTILGLAGGANLAIARMWPSCGTPARWPSGIRLGSLAPSDDMRKYMPNCGEMWAKLVITVHNFNITKTGRICFFINFRNKPLFYHNFIEHNFRASE